MRRRSVNKKKTASLAEHITSDEEQALWESKRLGSESKYAKKSSFYKAPAKLISIGIPDDVLEILKVLADKEGFRYQTYVVSLLKKHTRQRKAG